MNTTTKPIQARTLRPCPGPIWNWKKMSNMSTSTYVWPIGELSPNSKSSFDSSNTRRGKLIFHQRTAKPLEIPPAARVAQRISEFCLRRHSNWKAEPGFLLCWFLISNLCSLDQQIMTKEDWTNKDATKYVFSHKGAPRRTTGRSSLVAIQMLFDHPSHKSV